MRIEVKGVNQVIKTNWKYDTTEGNNERVDMEEEMEGSMVVAWW